VKHHLTRITFVAILALFSSIPGFGATTEWKIDPQHSAAQFSVRHLAISTVRGAFSKVTGSVLVDDQDISKSSVNHFPTMTFKSTKVEQISPGKLKVTGDLTIRGNTKPVVLDVDGPTAPVKDPWGNQRAAVNATTKINRQDFGVKWNATMDNGGVVVGDDVNINIDAEMIKQVPK